MTDQPDTPESCPCCGELPPPDEFVHHLTRMASAAGPEKMAVLDQIARSWTDE